MILVCISDEGLKKGLKKALSAHKQTSKFIGFSDSNYLSKIYSHIGGSCAVVVEADNPHMPLDAWLDLLDGIGRRLPVILVAKKSKKFIAGQRGGGQFVAWIDDAQVESILLALDSCGALDSSAQNLNRDSIPIYNEVLSLHMFKQCGSLSLLSIHTSAFRKVAIEYGAEAYHKLQKCLERLLIDLWGAEGSYRHRDILCRASHNSNIYYVLLERARSEMGLPSPGSLECMADQLVMRLQAMFWHEMSKPTGEKKLPDVLHIIPDFSVGYGTTLYNPCVEASESVESVLEASRDVARIQTQRMSGRRKELMRTLIQTDDLLVPFFQAVFNIADLSDDQILEAQATKSIKPLADSLYSFEALIRVNSARVDEVIQDSNPVYLEAKYLRPDVLFAMANAANLALELDQACLKQAAIQFRNLPGRLMVNILPRNFYYVDMLQRYIPKGLNVIFEVSESEAINNFDLLLKAKAKLPGDAFGIAIDDFGKGYAGLDRIIKIKPQIIKLDRSLVSDIDQDRPKRAFVLGLVSAAADTDSIVLAEGIERIEEVRVLRDLGVELIQGFLLHRPQSRADIEEQLGIESFDEIDTVA